MNILLEAAGCITSGYLLSSIREAGHRVIACDADEWIAARMLADAFAALPRSDREDFWRQVYALIQTCQVDAVIPNLDESLLGWSDRKRELSAMGVHVMVSDPETIRVCQDKWLTYQHFMEHEIPAPPTSLEQKYPLIKPRNGRGGKGIVLADDPVSMEGMISQAYVRGQEYTIDVFCDRNSEPIYIIPRKRWKVRDGKSTAGITVRHPVIIHEVNRICASLPFHGPINIQCFETDEGEILFTEINPRVAGGMALAFAASENWIDLWIRRFIRQEAITPKPVKYGLVMARYYSEVYWEANKRGKDDG